MEWSVMMKKILFLAISFLLFFTIKSQSITKPTWFSKHTITNTTPYTILLFARINGYNDVHGNDFGMVIYANSDSNDKKTGFFSALPVAQDDTFTIVGPISASENYIYPSAPTTPQEKDYTIVIQDDRFVLQ